MILGDLMIFEEDFTKKYDDFITVRFLSASKMRPSLLLLLSASQRDLNDFREELEKPSASILHGLKELERINLKIIPCQPKEFYVLQVLKSFFKIYISSR